MTSARPLHDALIVFGKVPEPGAVKTRLTELLTPEEAARLYDAFLRDALDAYRALPAAVRLYLAPEGPPEPADLAPAGVTVHAQRGDGLGERMGAALADTFLAGAERAVVIGTDHPTLPLAFVERAFEELRQPLACVLGPSTDGGYYLLGLNELRPQLFQGIAYSRPDVFARTLERAAEAVRHVAVLPEWYDVDTPDTLRRLAAELLAPDPDAEGSPARTRAILNKLNRAYGLVR
ncbi:MAG: TIGR04282 family arsenosugar biosynthesis glycosyltransferase [Rhodothermales bacterium]|nr:TIGR04282 family arsenosugar biosynthesis glycosyltransferase [Rhodothermales bacterium]